MLFPAPIPEGTGPMLIGWLNCEGNARVTIGRVAVGQGIGGIAS
jgi:hypothetical protein